MVKFFRNLFNSLIPQKPPPKSAQQSITPEQIEIMERVIRTKIAREIIMKFQWLNLRPFFTHRPIRALGEEGRPENYCLHCLIIHEFHLTNDMALNMAQVQSIIIAVSQVDNFDKTETDDAYFQCQRCNQKWIDKSV